MDGHQNPPAWREPQLQRCIITLLRKTLNFVVPAIFSTLFTGGISPGMMVPLTPLMFLTRAVKLYPNKIGVICGRDRFTYLQFYERVQQLSQVIVNLGTRRGDVVAFLSRNCHRLLEAYYGVVQAGAILLPLNIRLSAQDILYILNHSQARTLFLEPEFLP